MIGLKSIISFCDICFVLLLLLSLKGENRKNGAMQVCWFVSVLILVNGILIWL